MKSMVSVIVVAVILACVSISAAGWIRTYGGPDNDEFKDVIALEDGSFVMTGYIQMGPGNYDVWVVKIDKDGDVVWETTFGADKNDMGEAIAKTDDGFVIVGKTNSYGPGIPGFSNVLIVKMNDNGQVNWYSAFGGNEDDCGNDIIAHYNGQHVVVGYSWQSTNEEGIILYVSPENGTTESYDFITGSNSDGLTGIATTSYGFVAIGYTKSFGSGNTDVLMVKPTGAKYAIGGGDRDEGKDVVGLTGGDCIIVGRTESIGAGNADLYLARVTSSGGVTWENAFGGAEFDYGYGITLVSDGVVAVGFTNSMGAGYDDVYIVKADLNGAFVWEKAYGKWGNDHAYSVIECNDGGLLVVGGQMPQGGKWDGYVIRTDANGDTTITLSASVIEPVDDNGDSRIISACTDQQIIWELEHAQPLDLSSIAVTVDGAPYSWPHANLSINNDSTRLTFTPDVSWSDGDSIIFCMDSLKDIMDTPIPVPVCGWVFMDFSPPTFSGVTPTPGSTINTSTVKITAAASDLVCGGVFLDSIYFISSKTGWTDTFYGWSEANLGNLVDGDTFTTCLYADDNCQDYCASNVGDTCWVFYIDLFEQEYELAEGWNLISYPFVDIIVIGNKFPSAVLPAYEWDNVAGEYDIVDSVSVGTGFWLMSSDDRTTVIQGGPWASFHTYTLYPGWNLIGGPSITVAGNILTNFDAVIYPFFGFRGDSYYIADQLVPGNGYWVLAVDTVVVTLP